MTAVTNPEHEVFPRDDKRYRIFWAGEVLPPPAGASTLRVRIWLKEVDEYGADVPGGRIVQVTESAGTIPKLFIGSYWRNGRCSRPKLMPAPQEVVLEIDAPHKWQVVRAGDFGARSNGPNGGQSVRWIDPADLDLSFTTSNNRPVDGNQAWVVPARTTSGQEVILTSHEILRALLTDATSEFANELLSNRWDKIEGKYVLSRKRHKGPGGEVWLIDLAPAAPYGSAQYLALLSNASDARHAANFVYPELVRQGPASQPTWISAFPPVAGRTFRIRALTVPLASRNALLVTQILGFDPNLKVTHIGFTTPERKTPSGEAVEGDPQPRQTTRPDGSNIKIPGPRDRRPSIHTIKLPSASVAWEGLPAPRRSARRTTAVPIPNVVKVETEVPEMDVSVGVPGGKSSPRPGSLTPQEEREIANRFDAILELLDYLQSQKSIDGVEHYPLVRPTPAEDPTYCEFRRDFDGKRWKWSNIRYPTPRARLALVLEIKVGPRTIYWIETEAINENDRHHSLAVETVNGGPLEEGALAALLDLCAREKGVWPKDVKVGEGTVLCERARHISMDDQLSPNTVFYPLVRLAHKKSQPLKSATEGVSAEAAIPPV